MKESRESTLSELKKKKGGIDTGKDLSESTSSIHSLDMDLFSEGTKSKSKTKKDKNKNEKALKKGIKEKSFEIEDDKDDESFSGGPEIADIEALFNVAAADRKRAALYYKVRDAIKQYNDEADGERKTQMMLAVRESAYNYLLEKKGDAAGRKKICLDIVTKVDAYCKNNGITIERNPDYLVTDALISDKRLDMEIILAQKLLLKGNEGFSGNLKDRRKAFRKKIKDVRLARNIIEKLKENSRFSAEHIESIKEEYVVHENGATKGYDDAVSYIVSSYMNMDNVNDVLSNGENEESDAKNKVLEHKKNIGTNMFLRLSASDGAAPEIMKAKGHMIEGILADILSWNPSDFAFKEPKDFLKRDNFTDLYYKLNIADHADTLLKELKRLSKAQKIEVVFDTHMIKEAEARISLYKEIKKEYVNRAHMMNSPYYALYLKDDVKNFNTESKISALANDKTLSGLDTKKKVGSSFKDFLKYLASKGKRLIWGKKDGGEFTRGSDPVKLLNWHRKKVSAARRDKEWFAEQITRVNAEVGYDNEVLKHGWVKRRGFDNDVIKEKRNFMKPWTKNQLRRSKTDDAI